MLARARSLSLVARPLIPAHIVAALAAVMALPVMLAGCSRYETEPTSQRPAVAGAKAAFTLTGSAALNGHTVAIESQQLNSSGQSVCLDIPYGNAYSTQDVNYYPCHYGPSQQFVLAAWDAGFGESWVQVRPVSNSSVCFDIRGGTTFGGEHLQLYTCKALSGASAENQIFLLPPVNSPGAGTALAGTICVEAGYPKLALDVPLPASFSSYVQQFQFNGGRNQLWRLRDIQAGQYFASTDGNAWDKC